MSLNCLFAALSILLSGAAVFAGQVLVKQPSVSFCKFPARAGQPPPPPAGRLPPAIAGSPLLSTKTAPAGYPRQGLLYVSYAVENPPVFVRRAHRRNGTGRLSILADDGCDLAQNVCLPPR